MRGCQFIETKSNLKSAMGNLKKAEVFTAKCLVFLFSRLKISVNIGDLTLFGCVELVVLNVLIYKTI